MFAVAVPFEN